MIPGSPTNSKASSDNTSETDILRQRLSYMKQLMAERIEENKKPGSKKSGDDIFVPRGNRNPSIIDGNFLSFILCVVLVVIVAVSVYAFYHLYHAVLKKFPSKHEEL